MLRPPRRALVLALTAVAFLVFAASPTFTRGGHGAGIPRALSAAPQPAIDDIAAFLEECPTNDPMYSQIRSDFVIRREGVVVGALSCSEPISAMPVSQYTDELIVVQALRAIYYMEGGRSVPYPWTSSSLYDWMKTKIGGVDITASGSSCCEDFNGRWYVRISTQASWDRDVARQWRGISARITTLAHESRHVNGFPHVGGCPLFPDQTFGCDQTYDEGNLSAYGVEWWLNAKWLSGELYVGFSCASPSVVSQIADWHLQMANNEFGGRFVDTAPPTLSMPAQPGGVCPSSTATGTPTSSASPTPTRTPTATPTATPTIQPTPTPTASRTPTPTPTATATSTPTGTPSPSATAAATPSASATPTPTPSPTPTASVVPSPSSTPTPTPTELTPPPANVNCDDATDSMDVMLLLEAAGGLEFAQEAGCPAPGDRVAGRTFGDANCDDALDIRDVLALLRAISGLPATPCVA